MTTTTYTEQLTKLWHDADNGPYIEIWEEDLYQPLIAYAPLSALRTRLNVMEGFLRWNVGLNTGYLFSDLCVDHTIEPLELHDKNLHVLLIGFVAFADIFSPDG